MKKILKRDDDMTLEPLGFRGLGKTQQSFRIDKKEREAIGEIYQKMNQAST